MKTTTILALLAIGIASAVHAADQDQVDEKYLIPVPKEQRKVEVGSAKDFDDGSFSVAVLDAERTSVEVTVDDGEPVTFSNSSQTYIENGDRVCTLVYLGLSGKRAIISARCDPSDENLMALLELQAENANVEVIDPYDLVTEAAMGTLVNPYLGNPDAIAAGQKLFLANSCNGCHGGGGGGGMGPPLSNGVWVYGNADDTLFRLVILGSEGLHDEGFTRIAREKVVGPMPPYDGIIENADDLWKILAFVRSVSRSDAPEPAQ